MKRLLTSLAVAGILATSAAHAVGGGGGMPSNGCQYARYYQVPCLPGLTQNINFLAATTVEVAPQAVPVLPFQGNSLASVEANFPSVINWEFANLSVAALNLQLSRLSDLELARFSQNYYAESHGDMTRLMGLAAQRLGATNLVRMARAFGYWNVTPAVGLYAPLAVQNDYFAALTAVTIHQSLGFRQSQGLNAFTINGQVNGLAAPNTSMTLYEIYTEYLFTEAQTQMGALALTAKFALGTTGLGKAALIGWKAGGMFYDFATAIDPQYGYDITTQYGDIGASDFGPIDGATTGSGYVDLPDFYDFSDWCGC